MAEGMAQVIENLPSKHEVLSSNPRIKKKKKLFKERDAYLYISQSDKALCIFGDKMNEKHESYN
jgi:hypothetical protein